MGTTSGVDRFARRNLSGSIIKLIFYFVSICVDSVESWRVRCESSILERFIMCPVEWWGPTKSVRKAGAGFEVGHIKSTSSKFWRRSVL